MNIPKMRTVEPVFIRLIMISLCLQSLTAFAFPGNCQPLGGIRSPSPLAFGLIKSYPITFGRVRHSSIPVFGSTQSFPPESLESQYPCSGITHPTIPVVEDFWDNTIWSDPENTEESTYDEQREQMKVYIQKGLLYNIEPSTQKLQLLDTGLDSLRYVMDSSGRFYVKPRLPMSIRFTHASFTHASFFNGGPVSGAGHIRAKQGRITEINRASGHYKPSPEQFTYVLKELSAMKVPLNESALPKRYFRDDFDSSPLLLKDIIAFDNYFPKGRGSPQNE